MKMCVRIICLATIVLLLSNIADAQGGFAGRIRSLHEVLEQLYDDMMLLCSRLIGVGCGIAGFAATWYIASRVWGHIARAAIAGIIGGVLLAILFDKFLPGIAGNDTLLYTAYPNATGGYEIPFLIQMGWVFFFTVILIVTVSLFDKKGKTHVHALEVDASMYKISPGILAMIIIVLGITAALYIRFW